MYLVILSFTTSKEPNYTKSKMTALNKNILFVVYPGSGETYLSYCLSSSFQIPILDLADYTDTLGFCGIFKTNQDHWNDLLKENFYICYLVRDGRNAILSQAYNIINKTNSSPEFLNHWITEAILAEGGSYFNGWSNHANYWIPKADVVVRLEDFVVDPLVLIQHLSKELSLEVKCEKLNPYSEAEFGDHKPIKVKNDQKYLFEEEWRDVFSEYNEKLFYKLHYSNLIKWEYATDSSLPSELRAVFFNILDKKNIYKKDKTLFEEQPLRVLVDAAKLQMPHNDGIKRYVLELLKSYQEISPLTNRFNIFVYDGIQVKNIQEIDLEPYWYILPVNVYGLSRIKRNIFNFLKYCIKQTIPQKTYSKIGLRYLEWKSALKEVLAQKILIHFRPDIRYNFHFTKDSYNAYDLVHVTLLQDVDLISFFKEKALVTIHDLTHLTHPQYHEVDNIHMANRGVIAAMESKASLLAISKYTQQDVLKLNLSKDLIPFVYEAADVKKFYPSTNAQKSLEIRNKYNIPENARFYLSVSTLEPRKNLKNAIIAFQKCIKDLPDDLYFVIAGKNGWKIQEAIPKNLEISKRILFIGFVEENDLAWIYREAYSLVYVSHYEGFGLPLLEAMSSAKPVIYGNNSSMIEICKDAGIGVNSMDVDDISRALVVLSNNSDLYTAYSKNAFEQSNQFNWFKTGLFTLNQYLYSVKPAPVCTSIDTF